MMRNTMMIAFLLGCLFLQMKAQDIPRISPRPTVVEGITSPLLFLNGTWDIQTSTANAKIEVPGELTMQGFDIAEGDVAVYSRKFNLPPDWQGKRIKIRFDAVSSHALVKINGKEIGEHEGGMVPFELDITKEVKSGENQLQVEVQSHTISDRLGCVSQYAAHTVGGILRKVTLFVLPETNVAAMDVVTELDKSYQNATLKISAEIAFEGTPVKGTTIGYNLKDADGKTAASQQLPVGFDGKVTCNLSVKNTKLWNPEIPYLYTLTTTLYVDGKPMQINNQRVGLRQVEIKGNRVLVNGSPIKLHGVNRHEVHPLRGRSLTPELCRKDAELFRNGNCNYIRTSHYPPSEEFLDACDELGLFVECESALTWIQHGASPIWKLWNYQDKQILPYMVRANMDNVIFNRRHPSIIIWSIGNESQWSSLWADVLSRVKKLDPSRPTTLHDQCWGGFNNEGSKADIANYHYPGINGAAACDTMPRPVLFGEYAHLSCYNRTELVADPGIRAAYGKPLQQMYDSMYYHNACLGGAIWSGIDDVFHLPDGEIVGYGPWGPVDAWRREKPEYTGMKKAYTPLRILDYKETDKYYVLTVENRYDFIDLNRIKLECGYDENSELQPVKVNLKPHSKGQILIPRAAVFYLRATDPRGFVCMEEKFHNDDDFVIPEPKETIPFPASVEETQSALHIKCSGVTESEYTISKVTGLITRAVANGKVILSQGPVFSIVPMESNNGGKPNVANETYQNNIYPIKNYPLYTLFAKNIKSSSSNGEVTVDIVAAYASGEEGKLTYIFSNNGNVRLTYEIKVHEDVTPRQYGMLFQLPRNMDVLQWSRKGEFSTYPENDIARTTGTAKLKAAPLYEVEQWRTQPSGDWKDDANILGSADFRSTKTQIKTVTLGDGTNGLDVYGNNTKASRSWLQDGVINLLIADYNNSGSEPFYDSPFKPNHVKIKKDEVLKGEVRFSIY